jgi:hypothetical protein
MPPQPLPTRPLFNAGGLPISPSQYVGWIDAMGIQSAMGRSIDVSANFVFKLHIAVLESVDDLPVHQRQTMSLYPVMDGVYFVTNDQQALYKFLRRAFGCLAREFVETVEMRHRFLVGGALACGPVVHGAQLPEGASATLRNHPDYRDSILLGLPMIQAYLTERLAPPFSIYVHESARAFAPAVLPTIRATWWRWFATPEDGRWPNLAPRLRDALRDYFTWCEARAMEIGYDLESIKKHRVLADQYFTDVPATPGAGGAGGAAL